MGADVEKERGRQERHRKTLEFAATHEQPLTPGIEFTGSNADLALLYGDLQRGQLSMRSLERLSPETLDWIAAHTMKPEKDLDPEKWSKLRANAHRAGWLREKRIQEQRDRAQHRTQVMLGILAAVVALLTAAIATLGLNGPRQQPSGSFPVRIVR